MDSLFAFDQAVERLLEVSPTEPLPEQLAKLRFLFEEELRQALALRVDEGCAHRPVDERQRGLIAGVNAPRCRSSRAMWRR